MSYRRLWVLLNHLPQDSWTQTALRDDPNRAELPVNEAEAKHGPWRLDNYQLTALIEAVERNTYVLARVNGQEKYPAPEPLPRPGVRRASKPAPSPEIAEATVTYLNKIRARG